MARVFLSALLAIGLSLVFTASAKANGFHFGYRYFSLGRTSSVHAGRILYKVSLDSPQTKIPTTRNINVGLTVGYGEPLIIFNDRADPRIICIGNDDNVVSQCVETTTTRFPLQNIVYVDVPITYDHVWPSGWGVSIGGAVILVVGVEKGVGYGLSLSDVGVTYYFEKGLNLFAKADVGYAAGYALFGGGGGIGFTF